MKIISFCLWGGEAKYNVGAIRNFELARQIYPDWICRYYCGQSTPQSTLDKLMDLDPTGEYLQILMEPNDGDWRLMLERFTVMEDAINVECMISRDCDSRLSQREKLAVDEWLASDKNAHIMHCHFHHSVPILGGMWGIKRCLLASEMAQWAREWAKSHESRWQCDQDFLKNEIWPLIKNNVMNHADFHQNIWPGIPFPTPIEPGHFIGATYDENDIIDPVQLRQLYG
jgi:hypothetical protein